MSEHDSPADDLTRPDTLLADWETLPESHAQWQPGQKLGPFRLKRQLGRGGMGMVWLADQLEPLQREVAIKVMLPASQSRLAEAHFQVERQALAQLSHQAIAQIHDAGRLPDGGLFCAMEYVPGDPLNRYLETHQLSQKDLAELIIEICSGVQHAHQRGLIHRDIKPLNILVQQVDGRAQPKLIDFGVAVSTGGSSNAPGTTTDRAGTRAYMAPEQLDPDESGIDARCDVYALGAVLAQCLLIQAGVSVIEKDGFASESARQNLARSLGTGIESQGADSPDWLARLKNLPEELRAIALKAMAVDREQRYTSAAALADDLRRWLRNEPVTALEDSRWYRTRCFLRRNALASTAAGLVAVALVVGVTLALYGLGEARLERAEAETARDLAEQRRNDAEQLIQFMLGDFADRLRPLGRLDLLDAIGDEALAYLTERGAGGDRVSALNRARALRTLGEVHVRRQQFAQAEHALAQAVELIGPWRDDRSPESANLHFESGQIAFWRGAISYRQRDFDTTEVHWERYLDDVRALEETSDDPGLVQQELTYAYSNLGTLAEARNDWSKALDYFNESAHLRRESADPEDIDSILNVANTLSWISRLQTALGRPEEAWLAAREALDLVVGQKDRAPEHARRRQVEINLRFILASQAEFLNRHDLAAEHLRVALGLAEEDVANDPTQARRQAQLARIAFFLARLPQVPDEEAIHLLSKGELALGSDVELDTQQRIELPARHALARLQLNSDGDDHSAAVRAVEDLVVAIEARDEFDAHFFALAEVAVGLISGLRYKGHRIDADLLETLRQRLTDIPAAQQHSLRYLLIRHELSQLTPDLADQVADLDRRISALRAGVDLNGR